MAILQSAKLIFPCKDYPVRHPKPLHCQHLTLPTAYICVSRNWFPVYQLNWCSMQWHCWNSTCIIMATSGSRPRGGAAGSDTALQAGRSWVRDPTMPQIFFFDIIFPVALWPWGGKGGRCVGLTLQPSCVSCPEMWEPQSPATLRACPDL
jgi:hypothetical protein